MHTSWGNMITMQTFFAPLGCKAESHLVPSICKTWVPHTASEYYVGMAWEHYPCHKVYIIDTRHTRICSLVFFKHKYLTMPSLMPSEALIRAADDLTTAIAGVIPPPNMTTDAIKQLIKIFKTQAKKEKDKATLQRVLRENAQAERVLNKNMAPSTRPTDEPLARPTSPQATLFPPLEIKEYPDVDLGTLQGTPISNPDDDSNSA
jgi:hypothetical protein